MAKRRLKNDNVRVLDSLPMLIVCIAAVSALYFVCLTKLASNNTMRYMIQIFLYITMAQMWNLLSGFTGMTSLGQQLNIGLAGYSVAIATTKLHLSLGMGLLMGVGVSVVVALLMSLILYRMEGMYFSIATWVVAEIFEKLFLNWKYVGQGSGMTIRVVPYPRINEICEMIGSTDARAFYCKAAYKLSENKMYVCAEIALKGREPAKYLSWLLSQELRGNNVSRT